MTVDIYTKATCPYCMRAKALLSQKGVQFNEIKIDVHPEKRDEMIKRAKGGYTVPQIFINDYHVGGCDDLMLLEQQGHLDKLLAQA
jgi:glutaredoxin 3